MSNRLKGKWALVTGASSGFGAETARQLAAMGVNLLLGARREDRLDQVAAECVKFGSTSAHTHKLDVTCTESVNAFADWARATAGRVDVLINNVANWYDASIGALDTDAVRRLFASNVIGMVDLTNRIVPLMTDQGEGDIVNISSTSGTKGRPGGTAYAGTKWAVRGITQCWQAELSPHNIRVVSVCPSEVQTRWGDRPGRNNPNKLYADDIAQTIMAALDLPRRAFWPELAVFATNPWRED